MTVLSMKERIEAKRGTIAAARAKGLRAYKFKPGKTSFRILPALDPNAEWDRRFGVTYLKTFDEKNFFAIGDREITYGTADPIREMIFDAMREAVDKEMKDHYYKMLARPRIVFNALILDDKDQDPNTPVLIEVGETQFDNILAQFESWTEVDPNYDLASLDNGHTFSCEKTGAGLDTKYVFLASPKKHPLKPEALDKLIDMDAWIAAQFEMKEVKAIEFLAKLNAAAGLTTTVSAGSLTGPATTNTGSTVSSAAVTTIIDDEDDTAEENIVDAEVEDVLTDEQLAKIAADEEEAELEAAMAAVKAAHAAKAKAKAAAAAPVVEAEPAPAAEVKADAPAASAAADIDDILKGLE